MCVCVLDSSTDQYLGNEDGRIQQVKIYTFSRDFAYKRKLKGETFLLKKNSEFQRVVKLIARENASSLYLQVPLVPSVLVLLNY